ncbi:MAG: OmpA family protein [Sphingobacteriales bacterium]|nr:OmpA family protein [Sphingobacteriales bacterium]
MKTHILTTAGLTLTFTMSIVMVSFTSNSTTEKLSAFNKTLPDANFENVQFNFDKSSLKRESLGELDQVAETLIENKQGISLGGHADATGEYVYNWHLSKRRADAVKKYLVSKGVDSTRISATEFGDTKPIASNETEEGRQKNRRVEMKLL